MARLVTSEERNVSTMLVDLVQALASAELHLSGLERLASAWDVPSVATDTAERNAEEDMTTALFNARNAGRTLAERLNTAVEQAQLLRRLRSGSGNG